MAVLFFVPILILGQIGGSVNFPSEDSSGEENPMHFSRSSNSSYTIIINEIMANAENEDSGEFVELYNYGDNPVNVSGWYVMDPSDTNDRIVDYTGNFDWGMSGTIIPSKGYCLYVDPEYLGDYNELLNRYAAANKVIMTTCDSDTTVGNGLTNSKDSITVKSPDNFTITRSWSSDAGEGLSMGLIPDAGKPWVGLDSPTPGFSNGKMPRIIINEYIYNPKGTEANGEWIELYNAESFEVNMSGWQLKDSDNNVLKFPEINLPGYYYLVANVGIPPEENEEFIFDVQTGTYRLLDAENEVLNIYFNKPSSILTNTGDSINLSTAGGLCVDYVAYGDRTKTAPPVWYQIWSKPNPVSGEGQSLALKPNGDDKDSGENWASVPNENITKGWNNDVIFGFGIDPGSATAQIKEGTQKKFNFSIKNEGTVKSFFNIINTPYSGGWNWELSEHEIILDPFQNGSFSVSVNAPDDIGSGTETVMNLTIFIKTRPEVSKIIQLKLTIPTVELGIKWLNIDSSQIAENIILEGEFVEINARVYNGGDLDSGGFNVSLSIAPNPLLNSLKSEEYFFEKRHYSSLSSKSSRYPRFIWDTLGFRGNYTLNFTVDPGNDRKEGNEFDNTLIDMISIIGSKVNINERTVVVNEIYYDTLKSGEPDEFIRLRNPSDIWINISGWRLEDGEGIVSFPELSEIAPFGQIYIAYNAEEFKHSFGFKPDFEIYDSMPSVRNMETLDYGFKLTNTGDEIQLRTENRQLIDVVVYGNTFYNGPGWSGPPVPQVKKGLSLTRNSVQYNSIKQSVPLDTNTSQDWVGYRLHRPGQSEFRSESFSGYSKVSAFITPDAGFEPVIELIHKANDSIDISSYVFTNGIIKTELLDALNRGVEVRLLLSGKLGTIDEEYSAGIDSVPESEWAVVSELFAYGAKIRFMLSQPDSGIGSRYDRINSKYMIVDKNQALITTENFGYNGFPEVPVYGNRGYGIIIEHNGFAEYLRAIFEFDYNQSKPDTVGFDPQVPLFNGMESNHGSEEIEYNRSDNLYNPFFNGIEIYDNIDLTPVVGPEQVFIQSPISELIGSAKNNISVTLFRCNLNWSVDEPELGDTNPFLADLVEAAGSGVKVRILLDPSGFVPQINSYNNKSTDEKTKSLNLGVLKYLNQMRIESGSGSNLEVRLAYLSGLDYLHGNMMVVDKEKTFLGSFNWDVHELRSDRELGIIIKNNMISHYFHNGFNYDWELSPKTFVHSDEQGFSGDNQTEIATVNEPGSVLITEIFYDTYTKYEPDEYFMIHNTLDRDVDISGWFVFDGEGTLWFPNNTLLEGGGSIVLTRSASAYKNTFGREPDFEFIANTDRSAVNLKVVGGLFQLSNSGDEIVLFDSTLKEIDVVIYGNSEYNGSGWIGPAVSDVPEGRILKRNKLDTTDTYIDTDTNSDWLTLKEYYPRQSSFPVKEFFIDGSNISNPVFTAFVSPDSSYKAVSTELLKAETSIFVNVYEFTHDDLAEILCRQSENGLDVVVLIEGDPVGGLPKKGRYLAEVMQRSGVSVRVMINDPSADVHDRYAVNHGKYAVIDGRSVIIMSENWKATGVPFDNTFGNRGTGIIIRDRSVAEYYTALFHEDSSPNQPDVMEFSKDDKKYGYTGNFTASEFITEDISWNYMPRFKSKDFSGPANVTPIFSPDHSLEEHGSILEMLRTAEKTILIEQLQCYRFWFGGGGISNYNLFLKEAVDAAERGVEVRILLDSAFVSENGGVNDNGNVVKYINEEAKKKGLAHRLEARLINLGDNSGRSVLSKVHNKGIIVDGREVYVGSMNWGFGGPIKNREVGVIIEHKNIAGYYERIFNFDWNLSLNRKFETSTSYSSNIILIGENPKVTTEVAFFNLDKNMNMSLELELNIYMPSAKISEHIFSAYLNRTHVDISPGGLGKVTVSFDLREFKGEINRSNWALSAPDLNLYNENFMYFVELTAGADNMTTSVLWFDINYQEDVDLSGDKDASVTDEPVPFNIRDIEARWVLMVVIITMVLISVLRDMVGRKRG